MTRSIPSHSDAIAIEVLDDPGHGGACHEYAVGIDNWEQTCFINFQNGPIKEVGVNGLTHEVLLAILQDRLKSFQAGPYACDENRLALEYINAAQEQLLARTRKRMARGVEGKSEV